ncbi:MAG: hypothetical protein HKN17_05935, partial [Rhodothermales bacterium]|nr:hypothetical protein [Rhodothermales bacterium]
GYIHIDSERNTWIGTDGGLVRIDGKSSRVTTFTDALGDRRIWRIMEDSRGRIWVSSLRDVVWIDPESLRIERFWDRADAPDAVEQALAREFIEDNSGNIWISLETLGAPGRLVRYDQDEDAIYVFEHDPSDRTSWSGGSARGIHPHPTDSSRIYFTTRGSGLSEWQAEDGSFRHFGREDGLLDPAVYPGIFDDSGLLWLPTNSGLYRFDPESFEFRRFGLEYGLKSLEFNTGVLARAGNGELFFGGTAGVNSFFPSQIRANDIPPQVVITDFLLFNESVAAGPGSPLAVSISDTDEVRLAHHQDAPSFRFAALHYKRPEANRIRYRLEPVQPNWIDAGVGREASYTNLSPGEYTFRVIAANSDGVWNEEGASVRLVISAPWWARWWAYAIYAALLGAAVFAVDRVQRRRLVRREREAARERELEQAREIERQHRALEQSHRELKATQAQLIESEKLASLGSLTAGIAHEIKNPLNFVNNFAEVGAELADELAEAVAAGRADQAHEIVAELKTNAMQIAKHGRRADDIVKAMMQHARGGASERETVTVNAFLEEYAGLAWHGMRARDHEFQADLVRDFADDVGEIDVLPQELGRVVLNLLNNAFDAVRETHDASVRISSRRLTGQDGDRIEIRVSDNGPGIPADIRDRIFEPFFTTKPTGEGTGLGLSMSYDIVTKGHGGSMTVGESNEGGAEFVVTLPG